MRDGILARRANILGVGSIDLPAAAAFILDAVRQNGEKYVALSGFQGVSESALLNSPDGMPISCAVWSRGHKIMDRVYGPDLMLALCAATADGGVRYFFYGGAPGVAETVKAALVSRFFGLIVCGTYTPPFRPLNPAVESELRRHFGSVSTPYLLGRTQHTKAMGRKLRQLH